MKCPCLKCDPSGETFAHWYGFNPVKGEIPGRRRTHEEVVIAKRQRAEILIMKRAAADYLRYKVEEK